MTTQNLGKFQDKSRLKEFSDVMGHRMSFELYLNSQNYLGSTYSGNCSQDIKSFLNNSVSRIYFK